MKLELYYDYECPFCKEYSKYVVLKKKYDVSLFNARENIQQIKKLKEKGFDINTGMILVVDEDEMYHGADAARKLDAILYKQNLLDKFLSFIVRLPGFKLMIYPSIKLLRNIVLRLAGKNPNIKY